MTQSYIPVEEAAKAWMKAPEFVAYLPISTRNISRSY
jgi:hypothetical protein